MKPDGAIIQKTDNLSLFEFSLIEFADNGFRLENLTHDLHASPLAEYNIETEYEKNFSQKALKSTMSRHGSADRCLSDRYLSDDTSG